MTTQNRSLIINPSFYTTILYDEKSAEVAQAEFSAGCSKYIYDLGKVAEEFFNFGQTSYQVSQSTQNSYSIQVCIDSSTDQYRAGCNILRALALTVISGSLVFFIMLIAKVIFHKQAIAFSNAHTQNQTENIPSNTPIIPLLPKKEASTCRRIDKLGENERAWIPHQLFAKASNKKVYLFEVSHKGVIYLLFSKSKDLRSVDFSSSLKNVLEKNSMIGQRIATCYYASAYLHLELPQSYVISMDSYDSENSLIPRGMDHHQLLYQDNEEHIIIDPTWPRFEFYHSIVLLASNQKDLNAIYKIAFGRSYKKRKPFSQNKEDLYQILNIS